MVNGLLIQPGSLLLFIGDSITDAGRAQPVGESAPWNWGGAGNGYVSQVGAILTAWHPTYRIRVLNTGNSGNTVRDLKARWQRDVLDLNPDWLSIMIGINDVWRQFDAPLGAERQVPLDEYRQTLAELVALAKPRVKGLVLMAPYHIEPNPADPMRVRMTQYGAAVKELAGKTGSLFVDTQAAFDKVLETYHSAAIAWDRIHPGPAGHMVIARAFCEAVGAR
ncbi:MAG: SGNH/GDSL hydrolase family protein [Spirochaetes bacterium]|nr:SGNH/GDSL hydrolase family protein [Spirochaetota bacterium]